MADETGSSLFDTLQTELGELSPAASEALTLLEAQKEASARAAYVAGVDLNSVDGKLQVAAAAAVSLARLSDRASMAYWVLALEVWLFLGGDMHSFDNWLDNLSGEIPASEFSNMRFVISRTVPMLPSIRAHAQQQLDSGQADDMTKELATLTPYKLFLQDEIKSKLRDAVHPLRSVDTATPDGREQAAALLGCVIDPGATRMDVTRTAVDLGLCEPTAQIKAFTAHLADGTSAALLVGDWDKIGNVLRRVQRYVEEHMSSKGELMDILKPL